MTEEARKKLMEKYGYDKEKREVKFKRRGVGEAECIKLGERLDVQITPNSIVHDMVDLLPKELFGNPNIKVLNLGCKNGIFLEVLYWKFFDGLKEKIDSRIGLQKHILENILYGLCLSEETADCSRTVIYGDTSTLSKYSYVNCFDDIVETRGNIRVMELKSDIERYDSKEIIKSRDLFNKVIEREFGADMRFDVVIGNPPYNKGMDIDFVARAYELSRDKVVMITPAKWQTAETDQRIASEMSYGEFRKKLVPHMSHVVFYPDSLDIFGISAVSGIAYYMLDKNIHELCSVENRSIHQKYYNGQAYRSIRNRETLINIGNEIIESMGDYKSIQLREAAANKKYKVVTNTQIVMCGAGSDARKAPDAVGRLSNMFNSDGQSTFIGTPFIEENIPNGAYGCIFSSDDINECNSFISWLNCKFTRFFIAINISKLTGILNDDCFRFVPAPVSGKFDHLYTDQELYEEFNLAQKYIDVIEAVVKERK